MADQPEIDTPTPETRILLDMVAAAELDPLDRLDPPEARRQYRERAASSSFAAPDVYQVLEMSLSLPGRDLPARHYRFAAPNAPSPLIVYFHGGGMVIGDLDTHDAICRRLCNEIGADVISVEYRKAPETRYPGAAQDAVDAFRYICATFEGAGFDASRIFVAGDSAGGTLAAIVAQEAAKDGAMPLRAQVLIYPALDHVSGTASRAYLAEQFPINTAAMTWFDTQYFAESLLKMENWASPGLTKELAGIAPALVVTAGLDPLRDEGRDYAARLQAISPGSRHIHYPGTLHGFLGMGAIIPQADRAIREIARFLSSFQSQVD